MMETGNATISQTSLHHRIEAPNVANNISTLPFA